MICKNCIHHEICCNEGRDDEALTFCADFFEVVRCRDCKHRLKEWRGDKRLKNTGYWVYGCKHFAEIMGYWGWGGNDNDFCSYGERKESKVKKCFDVPKEVAEMLLEDTERKTDNETKA